MSSFGCFGSIYGPLASEPAQIVGGKHEKLCFRNVHEGRVISFDYVE